MAKYGTVQLPVISGFPSKVAVTGFAPLSVAGSNTGAPVMVATGELGSTVGAEVEEDVDSVPNDAGDCVEAPLPVTLELESPPGEHPTKPGAVSLTLEHSC